MMLQDEGETEVVSAHGALVKLPKGVLPHLAPGDIITIMHAEGSQSKLARVVNDPEHWRRKRLGIELDSPSLEFWAKLAH